MPQWYHKQDEGISAVDIPEAAKRVLQGAIDSRVDVGALSNNGTLGHSAEKYDTGVRDLTSQRVMVLIKATGEALSVQASRIELAARYDLSQRDLSLLDPWVPLPIPASFMVRKRAILANLGAVRLVISRCECIVITSGRVADMYIFGEEPDISDSLTLKMKQAAVPDSLDQAAPGTPDMTGHSSADHSVPFELRMLDTALEEACRLVGVEVRGVVQSGKERLKGLEEEKSSYRGSKILDELKEIRSNMGALRSRVKMLKKELEDVMEDDQDMLDMLLERRHVLSHMNDISMHVPHIMQAHSTSHNLPSTSAPPAMLSTPPTTLSPLKCPGPAGVSAATTASATGDYSAVYSSSSALLGVKETTASDALVGDRDTQKTTASPAPAAVAELATVAELAAAVEPVDVEEPVDVAVDKDEAVERGEAQGPKKMRRARQAPRLGTAEDLTMPGGFGSMIENSDAEAKGVHALESQMKKVASKASNEPSLGDRPAFTSTFTSMSAHSSHSQMTKLTGADRRTTGSHSVNLQAAASAEVPLHPQASVLPAAVSAPDQLPVHTSNAEPDRVPIGARIRQVSKVGQYGWGVEKKPKAQGTLVTGQSQELQASDSLRLSTEKRQRGSPHKGRFVNAMRNTVAGVGGPRLGGTRGPRSELSTPRSPDSHSDESSVHTVRSFTSDTEAIKLTLVKEEDPSESAARLKYYAQLGLGFDGRPTGALHATVHDFRCHSKLFDMRLSLATMKAQPAECRCEVHLGSSGEAQVEMVQVNGTPMHPQHAAYHLPQPPTPAAPGQQPRKDGSATKPAGLSMSGAGESVAPDSSAGLVRRESNRSSLRDDLLEDLLSHIMDVKFQTAPRHQPAPVNPHDIQDVENILEAYTLQLDYYLSQLSDLSADIEEFWLDTQQDLGKKRNALFALQILVNTVTMGFSFVAMVGAIFGMNLKSGVEMSDGVTFTSCGLAAVVTVTIMAMLHMQGMLSLKKVPAVAMS